MKDWTGLDEEAGTITNPGIISGGLPLINRGYRTLLSAGDQIVKNATKDFVHYGPIVIMRNPKGWYRPYIDQVKNGWQGWKDMKLAQKNKAIGRDINQPYFESFADRTGKFDGSYRVSDTKVAEFYDYPEYSEAIGDGVYARFKGNSPLMGVTQEPEMPNTYLFHIGGGGDIGYQIPRQFQMLLGRMKAAVPKYSYIGETEVPSSG